MEYSLSYRLGAFKGGAFNPLSLSPALWLSDTGTNAAQWDDLSGNSGHATQANGINQPAIVTNALNGRQVRRFDGSNDFLSISNRSFLRNLSGATFFAVANPAIQTSGLRLIFDYRSSVSVIPLFRLGQTDSQITYGGRRLANDSVDITSFGTFTASSWRIVTAQIRWSAAQKEAWATVGQNNLDSSFQTAGNSEDFNSSTDPFVGKSVLADNYFNGDIAEILVFPTALSTGDREKVERYLSAKYNIALA